jgi:hypothetical protein
MIKPAIEVGRQSIFAGMSARPVTTIVTDSHRFDEWHIEAQRGGDRPSDLGDFECMGHSRPLMIFGKHKDLCLAGESAEGRIVQDAVAVTFEARAMRVWCFLDRPISGPIGPRCMLGKDRVFPFLTDLASENRCCADFGSGVGMGQNDLSIGVAGHR